MLRNKLIALDHPSPDSVNHKGKFSAKTPSKTLISSYFQIDQILLAQSFGLRIRRFANTKSRSGRTFVK